MSLRESETAEERLQPESPGVAWSAARADSFFLSVFPRLPETVGGDKLAKLRAEFCFAFYQAASLTA